MKDSHKPGADTMFEQQLTHNIECAFLNIKERTGLLIIHSVSDTIIRFNEYRIEVEEEVEEE